MMRWLVIAVALMGTMGCSGFRGASASGSSGLRPVSMTSEIREDPVPTDRSAYSWADPF